MIDNHKYKSLIDSGAEICLIDIKNVQKNHNINNIVDAGIKVSGIGGSVKVHGKINLKVNVGNEKTVSQSFVIVDELANDLLLGADFIKSNNFIIDMANDKLLKRKNRLINIEPKAIEIIRECNLSHCNKSPLSNIEKVKNNLNTIIKISEPDVKLIKENISIDKIKPVINVNLENKSVDIDYTNGGVRLTETVNLKPQCSTNAAFSLDSKFKDKVNICAVGIFPDKAVINENLMIQSCVINSNCKNLVMPIINCSNDMIQLKAGTVVAFAQKLLIKNNGELAEAGFEWCKKEDALRALQRGRNLPALNEPRFERLHIPNCSIIQKPLSALTGKNKILVWNDDAEKAFFKLKQLLVSPQLLAYPDYNSIEPLEIHVDSSLTGAGAVLSQKQLGIVRPIAFISTSWGVTEQNYASTARELAGLRWAVKKLAPFLRGREFVIHTDNQPLIFLSNTKCVSQRLARTLEDLSDFNFKVKWIPGHSNIVADALS
ncbi:unnamed protein product, partial [Rotaria socialis]